MAATTAARRRPNDIAIEIEAGRAFGTGHHGTTAGCLDMLERVVRRRRPRTALDLGTGSAVLAIALARRARIPVLATDIDPVATAVAARNVAPQRRPYPGRDGHRQPASAIPPSPPGGGST